MVAARGRSRRAQCSTKAAFESKSEARAAARRSETEFGGGRLEVYRCPWCRDWHLGHHHPDAHTLVIWPARSTKAMRPRLLSTHLTRAEALERFAELAPQVVTEGEARPCPDDVGLVAAITTRGDQVLAVYEPKAGPFPATSRVEVTGVTSTLTPDQGSST